MLDYAYILSAGWGTRLRPLTFFRPKVLMPVGQKTLLELWLSKLPGFSKIFVNIHALAPLLEEHIKVISRQYFPSLEFIYEPRILGSGGSLFSISSTYSDRWILAINGDSFISFSLDEILKRVDLNEPSIYLVLKDEPNFNNIVVNPAEGIVKKIRQNFLTENDLSQGFRLLAYIGIQIFHSSLVYRYGSITSDIGLTPYMDIMEIYNLMILNGVPVRYIELSGGTWFDIGTVERYLNFCSTFSTNSLLGKNVIIEPEVRIESSVLWDGVRVKAGSSLNTCIVMDGATVNGKHYREIISTGRIWKF